MLCYKITSNKSQILICLLLLAGTLIYTVLQNTEHDLQFDIANVKSSIQI